jgi:hypothetical protein
MDDNIHDEMYFRLMVLINKLRKLDPNPIFYEWSKRFEANPRSYEIHTDTNQVLEKLNEMLGPDIEEEDGGIVYQDGTFEMTVLVDLARRWISWKLMPEYFGIPSDTARKEIELSLTVGERNWKKKKNLPGEKTWMNYTKGLW